MTGRELWFVHRPLYIGDILAAFRGLGFPCRMVGAREAAVASRASPPPAAVLDCNLGGPVWHEVSAAGIPFVGLPLDQWYFSPRSREGLADGHLLRHPLPPEQAARVFVFPCGPEQVEAYRAHGVRHAECLPFGVDAGRFRPGADGGEARWAAPVAFVGSPLLHDETDGVLAIRKAMAARTEPWAAPMREMLDALVERQAADLFHHRIPELMQALERERGLDFLLEKGWTPRKETWALRIGVHLSMRGRVEAVRHLAPLGLAVYGPEAWKEVAVPGMDWRGEADWATDLPKAVAGAGVHLNVSKLMFETGLAPRVLEVMAAGGLLLSNRNPFLERLFEDGRDLVFYETLDDLEAKARHYLAHPAAARAIGLRGMETVRARHTWTHRAARIVEVLREHGALPPA